jgi:Zeta toxin
MEVAGRPEIWRDRSPARDAKRLVWIAALRRRGLTGADSPPDGVRQRSNSISSSACPRSVKSSALADPIQHARGAFLADNDLAKQMIDEFDYGRGVSAVHRESSQLGEEVLRQATEAGENIVLPILGKSEKMLVDFASDAKGRGYTVGVYFVDATLETAMDNTVRGFGKTGRLVDTLIVEDASDRPRAAIDTLDHLA